ncbi:Beta-xylosidase [compost metagenome]
MYGSPDTLNEVHSPAFVGRRQQDFHCRASTYLSFEPQQDGEEAGITVYMNERFHYDMALIRIAGDSKLIFRRRLGTLWKVESEIPWSPEHIILTIQTDKTHSHFGFSESEDKEPFWFGKGECGLLATEVAGGFTGVFMAMYATGNGARSITPAHFDWFDYQSFDDNSAS